MRHIPLAAVLLLIAGCGGPTTPHTGGSLHGLVLLPGGTPASHADVAIVAAGQPPDAAFEVAVTDSLGRFGFSGIAAGSYVLSASTAAREAGADTVQIPAGEAAPDTLRLVAGGTFWGEVQNGAGNTPISGVRVTARGLLAQAFTDTLGRWTMPGVAPGTWTLDARRAGFASASLVATIGAPAESVHVLIVMNAQGPPSSMGASSTNATRSASAHRTARAR